MRSGELGPMMYLVIAVLTLLAVLIVLMATGRASFGVADTIGRLFP